MRKKLMLACMAITAFAAFVVAPVASASPVLLERIPGTELFSAVSTGASITGTIGGGSVLTSGFGSVTCASGHLTGTVTANTGTQIKAEIPAGKVSFTGLGTKGDCTWGLGDATLTVNSKICLETVKSADSVILTGCGSNFTMTFNTTGAASCTYSRSSLTGLFLTNFDAEIEVSSGILAREGSNFLCPTEIQLDWDIILTTTNGVTLLIG